jgi:Protein of unknown function (DUF4054)
MATGADVITFRIKFMELGTATDPQIASALNVADVLLGDGRNWISQRDFAEARMQLAAHLATMQLMQMANASDGSGMSDLYVTSVHIGDRSMQFSQRTGLTKAESQAGVGESMLESTVPGQIYMQLRARNIGPVMIV